MWELPAPAGACVGAADGAGGWYIGGAFTRVQGQPRRNLARLRADGTVDAWDPGADTTVRTLARAGTVVYAGGDFSSAGGAARKYLAAIEQSFPQRVKAWFENARPQFGLGWASAAAAAILMVVAVGSIQDTGQLEERPSGYVSVERISFEGDVTVLPDDGVTIIWLDGSEA